LISTCRSPKTARTITDDTRIVATLPTIEYALRQNAKVILASHLGRPKGKPNPKYSLRPVVTRLRELLDKKLGESVNVAFSPDCVGEIAEEMARQLESGQVLLLENLRFHAEEEANDPAFSKALASLAEVYVNDAFGSAHRAHASTEGITHYLKPAVAGLLMEKEITYLGKALVAGEALCGHHRRIENLRQDRRHQNLLDKVDTLVIVGGMAYTFQRALGVKTGKSLVEEDKIDMAKEALAKAKAKGVNCCCRWTTFWPTALPTTPRRRCGTAQRFSRRLAGARHRAEVDCGDREGGCDGQDHRVERAGGRV
jgi:phosphoglycerate kinase